MVSSFRGVLEFLNALGIYDVILPFLLVYTIMFAILEKTRVFGTDDYEGRKYPKKNLNAMMAFVTAFFVIASSRLVEIITEVSANTIILLMAAVLFLLLYGSFQKETPEGIYLEKTQQAMLFTVMLIGLTAIFLHAMKYGEKTWLDVLLEFITGFWKSTALSSIMLTIIVIAAMLFVTWDKGTSQPAPKQ